MAEPKDTTSFFRKVVKFVANPATDWTELDAPDDESRESDYAKGELKAMIERKRRNDFVRKREFDMLRKVRREGLSSEQLAALGGSSRIDDSEPRTAETPARQDAGVKAKIDEIEQQMVGDGYAEHRSAARPSSTTRRRSRRRSTWPSCVRRASAPTPLPHGGRVEDFVPRAGTGRRRAASAPCTAAAARAPSLAPLQLDMPQAERLRQGVRGRQQRGQRTTPSSTRR